MGRGWILTSLGVASAIAGVVWYVWYVVPPGTPQGYAGVEFSVMTPSAAARAPLLTSRGALIYSVDEESPAAKAGITPGQVVGAIDGVAIISAPQAAGIVKSHRAGDRVVFTVFDLPKGEIEPTKIAMDFTTEPPPVKKFSVRPPRVLAKEYFPLPPMAANAAWSLKLARGPTIRPVSLSGMGSGQCNAFAPDGWRVVEHADDNSLFHIAAPTGFQRAIYASAILGGPDTKTGARDFVLALIEKNFQAATPIQYLSQPFGFTVMKFGIARGVAGFAQYRVTKTKEGGNRIAVWLVAVPAVDAFWAIPRVGAVAFSIHCLNDDAPALLPRDPSLIDTSVSARCLDGQCSETDFAAQYMKGFRLGYVHDRQGHTWLIKPRSDFWVNGAAGPGYYRQIGGENEKLEPGRTN